MYLQNLFLLDILLHIRMLSDRREVEIAKFQYFDDGILDARFQIQLDFEFRVKDGEIKMITSSS